MTEQLEERYLLPEIMQVPERADEQVFYQIMKMAEKSIKSCKKIENMI